MTLCLSRVSHAATFQVLWSMSL